MRTCSQGEADTSADDFIINQPKCVIRARPKATFCAVRTSANSRKLHRAASAPGQQKVSNYFIDPTEIKNENYLPDLVRNRAPPPVCIVISSDTSSQSLDGPEHVSTPSSETQVFEYPNILPIVSDNECIVIADSK